MFHNELDRKIRLKMKFYCYEKMLKDAEIHPLARLLLFQFFPFKYYS